MKNIALFLAVLVAIAASGQSTIQITPASPSQGVSLVMGGSCTTISNVSFSGLPVQIGTFQDVDNVFGLTQGLIISSGNVADAIGPNNSTSSGEDLQRPGDASLSQIVGGLTTFDAAMVEFDFVSQIDDSVFVKFVFASEEYPEFVGTEFNDVFAFYVSGQGINGEQNIAVVPGTTIPIAINLINQDTYPQYYNDNTGGTYTQYDAYTIPLYAKFYAQAGQVYHIKLKISDTSDGIFDSAVLLQAYPYGAYNISGYVTYLGNAATAGQVYLYQYTADSTQAPLVSSQAIAPNGFYSFTDLAEGQYVVKAELDPVVYPNTYPKYHLDAITWDSATVINIGCVNYTGDINLRVLADGPGTVSGTIGDVAGTFKTVQTDKVFKGASVFLVGFKNGLVYKYAQSGEDGKYTFSNVPLGEYKIVVDIPGLYMDSVRSVSVINDEVITDQDYLVGNKLIYVSDVVILPEDLENTISLFPNPASLTTQLNIILKQKEVVTVQIFSTDGRLVQSVYSGELTKGFSLIPLALDKLQQGIYYVRVYIGDEKQVLKLVKSSN